MKSLQFTPTDIYLAFDQPGNPLLNSGFAEKYKPVSCGQPENAPFTILTPVVEVNVTFSRFVLAKAPAAMFDMPLNWKACSYTQLLNASAPTDVIVFGKDTSLSAAQLLNAELPIVVMLLPKTWHIVKLPEFENSPFGMLLSAT